MEPPAPLATDGTQPVASRSADLAAWIGIWLTLLGYGALAAPVPGVNEPHYLGKAKHYWDPAWCEGDLLFASSNAHLVFYLVMGAWAQWLTLPQLAWCGRAAGYGLMAFGWLRMHGVLGIRTAGAMLSLLTFLAIASWGNLSGEWIVGGIEGKVFSYGFLFLAFADGQSRHPLRAALWSGLAVSFHPIAGGWAILAWMLSEYRAWHHWLQAGRASLTTAGVMLLAALPGLIPAAALLVTNDSHGVRIDGTYLQVYYRLKHHLDPMMFPWQSWAGYCALLLCMLAVVRFHRHTSAERAWLRIVVWAGVFALLGLVAGWGPRPAAKMPYYLARMSLLKFYPFRLIDVMLPLTVAICLARSVSQRTVLRNGSQILVLLLLTAGLVRQHRNFQPTLFDTPEWYDVCRWVQDHTPADAIIQTPVHNQQFKWLAGRAEYVSYKDVPQDNASLVEWNRRLKFLTKWYHDQHADGVYANDELRQLRGATGITHILTDRLGPFELPPCYTNGRFQVYDLTTLSE